MLSNEEVQEPGRYGLQGFEGFKVHFYASATHMH